MISAETERGAQGAQLCLTCTPVCWVLFLPNSLQTFCCSPQSHTHSPGIFTMDLGHHEEVRSCRREAMAHGADFLFSRGE